MLRPFGPYPALAIVGGGGLAGLYGVEGGQPFAPGTGLQHLFAGDYRADLIHTATTLIRLPDGRVEYGNRSCDFRRHPQHRRPEALLNAGGQAELTWHLLAGVDPAAAAAVAMDGAAADAAAQRYWEGWYAAGVMPPVADPHLRHWNRTNLAALRATVQGGFVPADMSGQYFADGSPSYYARDALMVARALLLSGHEPEAAAVIDYLAQRPVSASGAFCQRYDAAGQPAPGQNNGVAEQFDSQGYFARLVLTCKQRTGRDLVSFERLARCLDLLPGCRGPQGLIGPEGGVNEGVWGPAYIVSTNLCAVGGLLAGAELAEQAGDAARAAGWRRLAAEIRRGVEAAWDPVNGRYGYDFVTYSGGPVHRYDAPQFFGPLYGCPLDARLRRGLRSLTRQAAFLGDGIGYGEQEYHHGPWVFNTAACAEYHALIGDWGQYRRKLRWLLAHSNGYGQMPEAVDADDPRRCFVNPLVWGCAEAVSALAILATADGHRPGRLPGVEQAW